MNWEELQEKQVADWQDFQEGYIKSRSQLYEGKAEIMRVFGVTTGEIPKSVQHVLDQAHKEWQNEWGIDGWRNKELKLAHEKEAAVFFEKERLKKEFNIGASQTDKKDMGR